MLILKGLSRDEQKALLVQWNDLYGGIKGGDVKGAQAGKPQGLEQRLKSFFS